jgi:Uma2 family endonuclease
MVAKFTEGFRELTRHCDLPGPLRLSGVSEAQFEELADENVKAELFDGVTIVHSPATLEQADVGGFLGGLMRFFADPRGLGKVFASGNAIIRLLTGRKFAPDAFFVPKRRVPTPLPKEFPGAPDLIVEVLSPSTREYDLKDKRAAYEDAGVKEMWFIDLEEQEILIVRKQARGYRATTTRTGKVTSSVLTGFWIEADWLWTRPLPDTLECLNLILGAAAWARDT